jgi:hypothetical protein
LIRRKQILVIGFGKDHCTKVAYDAAYRVGSEIAKAGAVLITGGLGGVMEASSRGAKERGGLVIGIIPQNDKHASNGYCDVVVATGLGFARDFLTAYSADAIVVVGGGVGTLIEMSVAYQMGIPIVALKGSGGMADQFADKHIDEHLIEKILGEDSPEKAVSKAFSLIKGNQ